MIVITTRKIKNEFLEVWFLFGFYRRFFCITVEKVTLANANFSYKNFISQPEVYFSPIIKIYKQILNQ
jgi:hypothetical protein